jgi:hypothetical protein
MVTLIARGVRKTGDTVATIDHNIVAYGNGQLLADGKDRSTPPLATYITAGVQSLFGESTAVVRAPFAAFGLMTIAVVMLALREFRASAAMRWLTAFALVSNVSFFLYARQCRYYALGMFATALAVWMYLRWRGDTRGGVPLALAFVLLFASNYLWATVLAFCLGFDWLLWRRKDLPFRPVDLAKLIVPTALCCGAIAAVWNPYRTPFGDVVRTNWIWSRVRLLYLTLRDINASEQIVGGLVLLALGLAIWRRHRWLARGIAGNLAYLIVLSALSPQNGLSDDAAGVRYLAAIIPLGSLIGAGAIAVAIGRWPLAAGCAAVVAFGTTLLQGGPAIKSGFRSTLVAFVRELAAPAANDPYTVTAAWIREHVSPGQSVWVVPGYMTYPLMYHASHPVYAWQLPASNMRRFPHLPPIHFYGAQPPDWIVVFGRHDAGYPGSDDVRYEHEGTIPHYWEDLYRPESMLRHFEPVTEYHPILDAINVFRRTAPPISDQ